MRRAGLRARSYGGCRPGCLSSLARRGVTALSISSAMQNPPRRLARSGRSPGSLPVVLAILFAALAPHLSAQAQTPNIVYILADDMGLGDVRSYTSAGGQAGVDSPVDTPNIDRLATAGMRFTNAHSSSAVCTPTRYGLLNGQYAWRVPLPSSRPMSGVLWGHDGPMIDPARYTLAELLRDQGYSTSMFGKWHLGNTWVTTDGQPPQTNGSNVDYSQPFTGGAIDHGFDYYFGDDVINQAPMTFIENDRTIAAPPYSQIESLPEMTRRSVQYLINRNGAPNPFFMYVALGAPHSPILPPVGGVPADPSIGLSAYTYDPAYDDYENFIRMVDWVVGELIDTLEDQGLAGDTMIVFAADNGVSTDYTVNDAISPGFINGQLLRGRKADAWEGGHRIPMLVRWDGQVAPGSVSTALVELTDFYATVVEMLGVTTPVNGGEDSVSHLGVLQGRPGATGRSISLQTSQWGSHAIRQIDGAGNEWKLIFGVGGGGFLSGGSSTNPLIEITAAYDFSTIQMFNLANDPGETTNLFVSGGVSAAELAKAQELQDILQTMMGGGSGPSGAHWTALTPATTPGSRSDIVGSSDSTGMLVFGGRRANGSRSDELWRFDTTTDNWVDLNPAGPRPAPRQGCATAYDTARDVLVVYGGRTANGNAGINGETWEWSAATNTWANRTPAVPVIGVNTPPELESAMMVYDAPNARCLMFGGRGNESTAPRETNETWAWNGVSWTRLTPATSPSPRRAHAMAFDTDDGTGLVWGGISPAGVALGDTWRWDGADWAQVPTATVPFANGTHNGAVLTRMVCDRLRGRFVLTGGAYPGGTVLTPSDTYEFDGTDWINRGTGSIGQRYGGAVAFVFGSGKTYSYGGYRGGQLNDTWEYQTRTVATFDPHGTNGLSCPSLGGLGTPTQSLVSAPWAGQLFQISVSNLSPAATIQAMLINPGSPIAPINLAVLNNPACNLLAGPSVSVPLASGTFSLVIPNSSSVIGVGVYTQAITVEVTGGPTAQLHIAASERGDAVIGGL